MTNDRVCTFHKVSAGIAATVNDSGTVEYVTRRTLDTARRLRANARAFSADARRLRTDARVIVARARELSGYPTLRGASDRSPAAAPILLVDDHPDDAILTVRVLRRAQIANEIVVVHDGADALDVLGLTDGQDGHPSGTPHLVLLDVNLANVDGLEVLRRLRQSERTRHIPVLVLTSSDDEERRIDGHAEQKCRYLRKPVAFDALVDAARELNLYFFLRRERPVS